MSNWTIDELKKAKERINAKKIKGIPETPKNLFGDEEPIKAIELFKNVLKALREDVKNVIWIPGNVVGKKNNYVSYPMGKAMCPLCWVPIPPGTYVCPKCGNEFNKKVKSRVRERSVVKLNKRAEDYQKGSLADFAKEYTKAKTLIGNTPIILAGIFVVRKSKQRFDYDNIMTMINDQLTASGIVTDDSADKLIMIPMGYTVNPKKPGIIIKFLNITNYINFLINECN